MIKGKEAKITVEKDNYYEATLRQDDGDAHRRRRRQARRSPTRKKKKETEKKGTCTVKA